MARLKTAKKKSRIPSVSTLNPLRTGMPALDSIVDIKEFKKGKKAYRLIRTNEVDEYEQQKQPVKQHGKSKRKKN